MATPLARAVTRKAAGCAVPHGVNPDLVLTLYPGGIIGLREARRRQEYTIAAGTLYAKLVAAEAGTIRTTRCRPRQTR